MSEEWRKIPGFPDYSVSSHGRVRRDTGTQGAQAGMFLKISQAGQVCLSMGGIVHRVRVGRLVAASFICEPVTEKSRVRYNDGDPRNCHVDNLAWRRL